MSWIGSFDAWAQDTDASQDGFIVDIDAIQAHGIGAVDIAKLKANGYYTIAVRSHSLSHFVELVLMTSTGCPCSYSADTVEDQRVQ